MKKKLYYLVLSLLIGLMLAFGFAACKDEKPTLIEISVAGSTEVYVDEFNYSDYMITALYDDNTTQTITLLQDYISQDDNEKLSTIGTHSITITYQNVSTDFSITLKNHDFDGITFENIETTYDGTEKTLKVNGAPENAEITYDKATSYVNAGEYTIKATIALANYNTIELTATLLINKATYDMSGVIFNGNTVVYNGQEHALAISDNLPNGVTVSYENNNQVDAGAYTVTAHFVGNANYNEIESMSALLTINKATYDMSGVSFQDNTFTYNGSTHSLAVSGVLPDGVQVAYENNAQTTAGEYEVTATFTGDKNYNTIENKTATLTINKATYDMSDISFSNNTFTYDGKAHDLSISGTLPNGVEVGYENNSKVDAGEYIVTATFTGDATNYNLIESKKATLTINKATYDMSGVSFADKTVTYNAQKQSIIATNLPQGVTAIYENNEQTNVGTYQIVAKFTGNKNYHAIESKTATLVINKATYDMSAVAFADKTVTYNAEKQSITATNLPQGVTVTYVNNEKIEVGEYTITAKFVGDSKNYNDIQDKTAKLNIIKASVEGISFSGKTFTYDGTSKTLSISGTLPEEVSVSYRNNGKTNAGGYTVTASFTVSGNYEEIPDMTATLTINKATYDMSGVDFSAKTVIYNGGTHSLEAKNLPDGVSVEYDDNDQVNAGRYVVTANFVYDYLNYNEIASMQALLIINKATYNMDDVSFVGQTFTYDGTPKSIYITGTLPVGVNVSYKNNAQTNVGSYSIIAEFSGDTDNYNKISPRTVTMVINKADYNMSFVRFLSRSFVYDGTAKSLEVSGGLPDGVTVQYLNSNKTDVGQYMVTAKFTGDAHNYNTIADMTATLTITQAIPFVEALCEQLLNTHSNVELIADTEVAGTIAFDDGQMLVFGTNTYTWTFVPDDTHNYSNVTGTIDLTVGARVQFYNETALFDNQTILLNNSAVKPESVPTKIDSNGFRYTFAYWSLEQDGTEYSFTNTITKDITLYAVYTSQEIVYTIYYYNTKGVENTNLTAYTVSTNYTLMNLQKEHYNFEGWKDSNGSTIETIPIGTTGDLDIYATWTPVEYVINYVLGYRGVDNSANQETYNIENAFNFNAPVYDEYHSFDGWYLDEELTTEKTAIALGEFGNITLYAKWEFLGTYISTADELQKIIYNMTGAYELTNDIDLTDISSWIPIGDSSNPFKGYINGNNYSIKGKMIFDINAGSIKCIKTDTILGNENQGTVEYCTAKGFFIKNEGLIYGSHSMGFVQYSASSHGVDGMILYVGGIVAKNNGSIEQCVVTGDIKGSTNSETAIYFGGLAGTSSGIIKNSYVNANLTIYNTKKGDVSGDIGGLVGENRGSITSSYVSGTISGSISGHGANDYRVTRVYVHIGSIVGTGSGCIDCFSSLTGHITASSNAYTGYTGYLYCYEGIISYGNSTNCYSVTQSLVWASGATWFEDKSGTITNIYNLTSVNFLRANLAWDESIWFIQDGDLPKLRFELE